MFDEAVIEVCPEGLYIGVGITQNTKILEFGNNFSAMLQSQKVLINDCMKTYNNDV